MPVQLAAQRGPPQPSPTVAVRANGRAGSAPLRHLWGQRQQVATGQHRVPKSPRFVKADCPASCYPPNEPTSLPCVASRPAGMLVTIQCSHSRYFGALGSVEQNGDELR